MHIKRLVQTNLPPPPFHSVISQVMHMLGVDYGRTLRNIHHDCRPTDPLPEDFLFEIHII